ncbi:hypothetical protein QR680_002956 [Steinernema hermaphroditum]|uniref:Uncharacterized protein n=1 Tax=Steinernema hermaphroditum TaxID=289476 RepID=A0AA39H5P6_9BILA|nr:hypothetical protein QR680_002956 [Steinernema hermaphroditum]
MNDNDAILWKLGILTSKLESPRKHAQGFANAAVVDNDESDSEIVFDQKTLLENQRGRSRTSPSLRPARARAEALRWKLTCICAVVFAIGVSLSVFGPNACEFVTYGTTYRSFAVCAFVALGAGYLAGTFLGEQLFLRWNPFFVFLALFFVLVPSLASLSITHGFWTILFAWMMNGLILGSLERGCYLLYHALFKERRSLIFAIQLCMIVGLLLGSFVFSQSANNFDSAGLHLLQKRAISGFSENETYVQFANLTEMGITTTERPKRPDSAVGVQQVNGKTEENEAMRKQAEEKKKNEQPADATVASSASAEKRYDSGDSTIRAYNCAISHYEHIVDHYYESVHHYLYNHDDYYNHNNYYDAIHNYNYHNSTSSPLAVTVERVQYIAAAAFVLLTLIPFVVGFCCCCLPFGFKKDDRIAEIAGDQYLDSDCGRIKAYLLLFWTLMSFCDVAVVGTIAGPLTENQDHFSVRLSNGMMIYWGAALLSRKILLLRPSPGVSPTVIITFLVLSTLSAFVLMLAEQDSLWGQASVFLLGAFGSPLSTCLYNWILSTLGANTFAFSRVLGTAGSFGKMLAPVALISWSRFDQSSGGAFKLIFVGVVVSAVLYLFIVRQVHTILRRRQIGELSSGVTGVSFHRKTRKGGYVTVLEDDSDVISMEDIEVADDKHRTALLQDSDYED